MPFAEINCLLRDYAALPIDAETGTAYDDHKEREILAQLHDLMNPLVQACVAGLWPRVPPAERKDVEQEFWLLFVRHLHQQRKDHQPAVQIRGTTYVRWWVSYAAGSRGRKPCDQLNSAIHDYLNRPPDERDRHGTRLLVALKRCCEEVLKANHARGQGPIRTTEKVAQALLGRFAEGTIWNVCITPMYAQCAEYLESNDEDGGMQRWAHLHRYVDRATFRAEAWPLLFDGDPPDRPNKIPPYSPSPNSLIPEEYREPVRKEIEKQFGKLDFEERLRTFRHLSCLVFLGYFEYQHTFCIYFDMNDGYADKCKGFWLEKATEYLASLRGQVPQKEVLKFYKSHEYYGQFLDCLHDYRFIACAEDAREDLKLNHVVANDVLLNLWNRCFREQEDAIPPVGFQFRVAQEERPQPLVEFKWMDPPPEAVTVKRG